MSLTMMDDTAEFGQLVSPVSSDVEFERAEAMAAF